MKIEMSNGTDVVSPYPDRWAEIVPNGAVCPFTGLKHGKLYTMLGKGGIARPYVRVANLRDPRAKQGKTLFHLGDMLRYLDLVAQEQGSGEGRCNKASFQTDSLDSSNSHIRV